MSPHILLFAALLCPTLILSKPSQKTTEDYCYSADEDPYLFFGTKTAYEYNHGDLNEDTVPESK